MLLKSYNYRGYVLMRSTKKVWVKTKTKVKPFYSIKDALEYVDFLRLV